MYKVSYSEIMQDDCSTVRSQEQTAIDHAIELMKRAETKGVQSPEAEEAIQYVQRLWTFFIENLCDPDNELAATVKDDLISIGLWTISEADRLLAEEAKTFTPLIDINQTIRDGLS